MTTEHDKTKAAERPDNDLPNFDALYWAKRIGYAVNNKSNNTASTILVSAQLDSILIYPIGIRLHFFKGAESVHLYVEGYISTTSDGKQSSCALCDLKKKIGSIITSVSQGEDGTLEVFFSEDNSIKIVPDADLSDLAWSIRSDILEEYDLWEISYYMKAQQTDGSRQ